MARLLKGLFAGVVLGATYAILLNSVGDAVMRPPGDQPDETSAYVAMMWRAGPIALGLASALFFPLMRWAVGLSRIRILVFDDAESTTESSPT